MKSWLIWKDPDAGKDWGQEKKGMTEDEMVGWHHRLDGHGFRWTPGVGDGQGGLACCGSWGCKESDTIEQLNWTELNASYLSSIHYIPSTPDLLQRRIHINTSGILEKLHRATRRYVYQPISIYPKENSPSSLFQNKNKPLLWTSVSTNILRNHEAKIRAYSINLCSQIALQEKSVPFHLVHLAKMSFPSVKKRHCPHSHFWKKKLCFLNVWDKKQTERFLRLIRE